jgi:hypothetical protein
MKKVIILSLFFFTACTSGDTTTTTVPDTTTTTVPDTTTTTVQENSTPNFGPINVITANDFEFPKFFYTTEIKECTALPPVSFDSDDSQNLVESVIGFDWHKYHMETGTSLVVDHSVINLPMQTWMIATHNALINGEDNNLAIAKDFAVQIAKVDTLHNSYGYEELKDLGMCWENNDPDSPCHYHEYEFAANWFGMYLINMHSLKDEFNQEELKEVNRYIKKMFVKFLEPRMFEEQDKGFYGMANQGILALVYASWTDDKELATQEFNFRFQEMNRLFLDDGYIYNNSFRGTRGQWYHSYGVNIGLGYVHIAQAWNVPVPEQILYKLKKSAEIVNLAITDYDKFTSRELTEYVRNATSEENARKFTHQMAFGIDVLMKRIVDVDLVNDPTWMSKKQFHIKEGIDTNIGFNPLCI